MEHPNRSRDIRLQMIPELMTQMAGNLLGVWKITGFSTEIVSRITPECFLILSRCFLGDFPSPTPI